MNAFNVGRSVEARGMVVLLPFLNEKADGRLVVLDKGPLARALQETVGDVVFTGCDGSARSVELKTEEEYTGNLFLETWSNRNLETRANRAMYGSNVGWLYKSSADLLFYYFLDNDSLFVFDLLKLQRWAFCRPNSIGTVGRLWDFREVHQGKYKQNNDTHGRLVPLAILEQEVGYKQFSPQRLMEAA